MEGAVVRAWNEYWSVGINTFTNEKGEYHFRFADNHLAYKHCQERTEQAMKEGIEKVFLDNVFTLDWEIEPYFKLAEKYQYSVFVTTVPGASGVATDAELSRRKR